MIPAARALSKRAGAYKTAAEDGLSAAHKGDGRRRRAWNRACAERGRTRQARCKMATAEAESSFGNPDVYIEKDIEEPRHIEIQILGDEHGHYVHLGERECSIQTAGTRRWSRNPLRRR